MKKMMKQCIAAVIIGCMTLGVFSPGMSYAAEIQETDTEVYQETDTEVFENLFALEEADTDFEENLIEETENESQEYDFSNIPKDYEVTDDAEDIKTHRVSFGAEDSAYSQRTIQTFANSSNQDTSRTIKAYGVDISKHNGVIDWAKVKAAGVNFAIIRVGGRGYGTGSGQGTIYEDSRYEENLKGAIDNGINVGVYFFSTAINEQEALEEAKYTVNVIKNYNITYPVVYDCEEYDNPNSRNYNLSNRLRTDNALTFLKYVESQGYKGMMYSSSGHFRNESRWETSRLDKDYDIWVANYPYISIAEDSYSEIPNFFRGSEMQSSYEGAYRIWQCSSAGAVDGIKGDVDLDIEYQVGIDENYTGLLWVDSILCYVENGRINDAYTGIVEYNGDKYYVENGEVDTRSVKLLQHEGKEICVKYGVVTENYTGLVEYGNKRVYLENGVRSTNYTGLISSEGTWYYVQEGVFNGDYTGLTKYRGTWYYVKDSILGWNYTGLTKYQGTWYYVQGSILGWNYTGLTKYQGTWYYVKDSILGWNYTGLTKYQGTWYYVKDSILGWNYTGLTKYQGTWYYVKDSILGWNYTGITEYQGTWYYVRDSILDWNFSGTVTYNGRRLRVVNGIVQ